MKYYLMIVPALLFILTTCSAQLVPEIHIPEKPTTTYEKLQNTYYIKTTQSYKLYGNVKSVTETETKKVVIDKKVFEGNKCYYEFLPNHNLLLFRQNDTIDKLENSNARIEKYLYDNAGEKLVEAIYCDGTIQQNANKVIRKFSDTGCIIEESYQRFYENKYALHEKYMWDYKLNYLWSKNLDTVNLKYNYKTANSSYQRFSNVQHIFNSNKLSTSEAAATKFVPDLDIFKDSEARTYDSLGNLTKIVYYDRTIKSSFNQDNMFEYKYNDKSELTELKMYFLVHNFLNEKSKDFEFLSSIKIEYLKRDKYGNWIEKKVSYLQDDSGNNAENTYKRTIKYFDK